MKLPHKNQQGELAQGSSRLMKPYKKHRKSKLDSVLHPSKAPCSSGTGERVFCSWTSFFQSSSQVFDYLDNVIHLVEWIPGFVKLQI
jgi:hypothetical protein